MHSQEKAGTIEEKFNAIGYYEYTRKKKMNPSVSSFDFMIFDADNYIASYGTVDRNGRASYADSYTYSKPEAKRAIETEVTFSRDIDTAFHDHFQNDTECCELIERSLEEFNRRMRLYYQSDKLMNMSLADIFDLNHDCDCEMSDKLFDVPRSRISSMLKDIINGTKENNGKSGQKRAKNKFDIENCDIVIIGRAALYYPVKHYIKEILCADPLLSDKRFVSDAYAFRADETAEIAAKEYDKVKARLTKEQLEDISLTCVNKDGGQIEMPVSLQKTGNKGYNGNYTGPILISKGDKLRIDINSEKTVLEIPYPIETGDCDLIEIGAKMDNDRKILCIRRCGQPEREYEIPITE